jgi:hypothetical protein
MYTNVTSLLARSSYLHRYPFTVGETLDGLLPPETTGTTHFQWRNLREAIRWEQWVQFKIDACGDKVLFWIRDPQTIHHPTPVGNDERFDIHPVRPHYGAIAEWAEGAAELDVWLENAHMYLNRVLKTMKHPMWVERFWPELVPFVGSMPEVLIKGMREPRPTSLSLDAALQDEIQNKLTMCALLPKDQQLHAWVGRYVS